MLSAFSAQPIVELKSRDKSKIESILAHSDQLFVGLNTGSLRIYRVTNSTNSNPEADHDNDRPPTRNSELLREYEKFSKHKIEQLAIFREANILISLSNGLISIHDLNSFELQEQLTRTKGTSTFAVTSNIVQDTASGVPTLVSRLAVAVKRRLLLWTWHDGELLGDAKEIALANSVKTLTWASGTKFVAGLNSNYVLVDIETEEIKTIIGPGSIGGAPGQDNSRLGGTMSYIGMGGMVPTPLATELGDQEMLLARDINTHFIDRNGDSKGRRQIPWKTAPSAVGYSYPYLLSLQEPTKGLLEVRNPQTLTLLQSIELPGAVLLQVPNPNISLAHQGKGFFVSSERMVWRMQALHYDAQIDALVDEGQLEEAISLLEMIEETLVKDKQGRLRELKMQRAQKLFDEKHFRESLDLFGEVCAPPERVIKLYPPLIAGNLANRREDPNESQENDPAVTPNKKGHNRTSSDISTSTSLKKSQLESTETASIRSSKNPKAETQSEKELKASVRELQAYLADVRRRLQRFFNSDQSVKKVEDVQNSFESEDMKQIVENILGVSDLQNGDMVDKLLETAKMVDTTLFRAHMFATPSLAGSLFRIANFCDPEVVMDKLEETERYSDLIDFLYGKRLHRQALERLKKFGQSEKTENIDPQLHGPERTISYLKNLPPETIDLILEFARWPLEVKPEIAMEIFIDDTENAESLPRDKVEAFLEGVDKTLAQRFLEHVINELNDMTPELHQKLLWLYLDILKDSNSTTDNETMTKFLTFLEDSSQYSAAKVLNALPKDEPKFYEARAIVFSKMGNHKQALEIYVFKLKNTTKAEEYCNHVYRDEADEPITMTGRRSSTTDPMDEQPSVYHILLNLYLNPPKGESALRGPAIELMARHGARLPANSTLHMIPSDLLIQELEFYFRGRIRNANTTMNESHIVAGLRKVEAVRVQAGLQLGDGFDNNGGRSRRVRIDEDRVCGVCYKRLAGSVISVFPDNTVVHLGCANRRQNEIKSFG